MSNYDESAGKIETRYPKWHDDKDTVLCWNIPFRSSLVSKVVEVVFDT